MAWEEDALYRSPEEASGQAPTLQVGAHTRRAGSGPAELAATASAMVCVCAHMHGCIWGWRAAASDAGPMCAGCAAHPALAAAGLPLEAGRLLRQHTCLKHT